MRTKTLLLTAAALLAVGIVSSQAQSPVYSQNVVGYASVATPGAGSFYMMTCPFVIGVSNGINEVFGTTLPSGSTVYTWNINQYVAAVYDTSDPDDYADNYPGITPPSWYQGNDSTPLYFSDANITNVPCLKVGQGFFLVPNGPVTTTFAGTVGVNVGSANNMSLPNGGSFYMVGSVVPYAGYLTNGTSVTGGPNLNNLPSGSTVYLWNVNQYVAYVYDTSDPDDYADNYPGQPVPVWYQGNDSTPSPAPQIGVGQGFFIVPNTGYTWRTGL
jgi:hypothetical protein